MSEQKYIRYDLDPEVGEKALQDWDKQHREQADRLMDDLAQNWEVVFVKDAHGVEHPVLRRKS